MKRSFYLLMISSIVLSISIACAGETETIVEEKIVEVEVEKIVEKEVEVEKIVEKERVVEKVVPPPDYKPGNRGDVAREDTLIITGFGPGATQWEGFDNLNPYSLGGLGRVRGILNKTIYEYMYYYNHNTGEEMPWLATSYDTHTDGMGVDVTLRKGIEWSDGESFTCDDVKYTIELLRDTPELVFASDMNEWVKDVNCKDDHNFTINLNKPNVRFFYFYFVENSEIHIQILPKHIWENEDPLEFNNWDPDKGYPVGTGPYVAVEASEQGQIFDRNDAWLAAETGFSHLPVPLRVAYIPPGSADTAVARNINNEFDVASINEIKTIKNISKSAKCSFMHTVKSRDSIKESYFKYGVRAYSLDSKDELMKIIESTNNAKDLELFVRVSVSNEHAEIDLSKKFGAMSSEAAGLLRLTKQYAKKIGLSFHVGSQCMHPISYSKGISEIGNIIKRTKIIPDFINVGGGFPTIYPDLVPQSIESYFEEIKNSLANLKLEKLPKIICEPGRAIVAESGSTIVRVNLRKKQKLYINDGTYGSLFDAGFPNIVYPSKLITNGRIISKKLTSFDFYGPTCDSMDYMKGPFILPNNIKENDYIELGQLGAYGLTFRTDFNGLYSDNIFEVEDSPIMTMYNKEIEKKFLVA